MAGRHVVLLRGVNVGGNNRVPMATLRSLLGELGAAEVSTYLQSGNAVCSGPDVAAEAFAREVEAAIGRELGLSIRVLVRDRDDLARVVADNPLPEAAADGSRLFVTFLGGPADPAVLARLDPTAYEPDRYAVGAAEIYMWCRDGLSNSELPKAFSDGRLRVTTTTRNWNTVTRLLAMADP
ncbi:MAG: DUF1697 domain-containing protein [Mycobacteriales bacterium]